MNKFLKILILPIVLLAFFGFASQTFAQPLSVSFVPDPLFDEANFLPLDETSGEVTVVNNSGETQTILTEAINVSDDDNFGSLLHLKIVESDGTLFDNSLAYFFSTAGEFPLGLISNGQSKTFTYTISFIDSNDNSYQGRTLGFDICVGFEGGQTRCGDTVVGDEENTDGGDNNDGGAVILGSGGGGGTTHLIISNEQAKDVTTTATITWDTNKLSTSQVVYGSADNDYVLDLSSPTFGYPSITAENLIKTTSHSIIISGLLSGQTYKYRVVSRASPATISFEHQFTVPTSVAMGATTGSAGSQGSQGEILGVNTINSGEDGLDEEIAGVFDASNLASAFASGWDILSSWWLWILLILLATYFFWRFVLKSKNE